MKRSIHPYHLLGLAAISFAMLFLFKINKVNFYHHYFRVIEEVEIRNSQALASPSLVMFSPVSHSRTGIQPLLGLFSVLSVLCFFSPRFQQWAYPSVPAVRCDMRRYYLLPRVRAP